LRQDHWTGGRHWHPKARTCTHSLAVLLCTPSSRHNDRHYHQTSAVSIQNATKTEKIDPSNSRGGIRPAMKLVGFLGFCGGFLMAYQRSSCKPYPPQRSPRVKCAISLTQLDMSPHASPAVLIVRFMGLSPNEPEAAKDMKELSARAAAGEPLYGETDLSPYLQGVAARNSTWSQLKLGSIPW
jgi:hypothetical protein